MSLTREQLQKKTWYRILRTAFLLAVGCTLLVLVVGDFVYSSCQPTDGLRLRPILHPESCIHQFWDETVDSEYFTAIFYLVIFAWLMPRIFYYFVCGEKFLSRKNVKHILIGLGIIILGIAFIVVLAKVIIAQRG